VRALVFVLFTLALARHAHAWVLHEHEAVVAEGARVLSQDPALPEAKDMLGRAFVVVSSGRVGRACDSIDALRMGGKDCIALATLTALAADHSCRPSELGRSLREPWVDEVLDIGAETGAAVVQAARDHDRSALVDAWRDEHIRLQFADPEYLSRAGGNNGHFQDMRKAADESLEEYLLHVLDEQAPPSAINLYAAYHFRALLHAHQARNACAKEMPWECTGAPRDELWQAFLAEAFALHFLADAFSAGHFVGTWGDKSTRMGTHDYYSLRGVDARQWNGAAYVAHGDASLESRDSTRAAPAISTSLKQLARAMMQGLEAWELPVVTRLSGAKDLDSCRVKHVETAACPTDQVDPLLVSVVTHTPIPALEEAALPRVKNDVGAFVTSSIGFGFRQDAYPSTAPWSHIPFGLKAAPIGIGFSIAGITSGTTDSLLFLRVPIAVDGSPPGENGKPRVGLGVQAHIPFYVLPFDTIPIGMVLGVGALVGSESIVQGATRALNDAAAGSVYGHFGRRRLIDGADFQIVAGREATFVFYLPSDGGRGLGALAQGDTSASDYWKLELPLVSLAPTHEYSGNLALRNQLALGYDLSHSSNGWVHGVFLSWTEDAFLYFFRPG